MKEEEEADGNSRFFFLNIISTLRDLSSNYVLNGISRSWLCGLVVATLYTQDKLLHEICLTLKTDDTTHAQIHTYPRKYEKVYFPHNEAFWGEQSGSQQDMKIERSKKFGFRFLCCLGKVSWDEGLWECAEDCMILTSHLCQRRECLDFYISLPKCGT